MEKRGFRPAIKPLLFAFALAPISYLIYYGSRRVGSLSRFFAQGVS